MNPISSAPPSCRVAVIVVVHDDTYALPECLTSANGLGTIFLFVSRKSWNGLQGDWSSVAKMGAAHGARVIVGEWHSEQEQRGHAYRLVRKQGYDFAILLDADEVLEHGTREALVKIANSGLADRILVSYTTHWKGSDFVVMPAEPYKPLVMVNCKTCEYLRGREFVGGTELTLAGEGLTLHHFGYCGPDSRIRRKVETWRHGDPLVRDWFAKKWLGWDRAPATKDLHPTSPTAYGYAMPIEASGALSRLKYDSPVPLSEPSIAGDVSIIIPVYGGTEDIQQCLRSIEPYHREIAEVIVVDNDSPKETLDAITEFEWITVVSAGSNLGFGGGCNLGFSRSKGSTIVFLNSDTVVPRVSLATLLDALWSGDQVGAVGPYTNYAGYGQGISQTYDSISQLGKFAELFARSDRPNVPVDMLVGFCLAVKRSALDEVGAFDTDFGLGLWEDNDLCYRLIRAGYRLTIASRSYVHHHGSKTLNRMSIPQGELYERNRELFEAKWSEDVRSGFSSGLSGIANERIRFRRRLRSKSKEAVGKKKLASAICCTYARPRLLEEAIASFLAQDYEPKELIIVNDFAEQPLTLATPDPRIRVYNLETRFKSLGAKRNFAKSLALGEYHLVWDDDDLHMPWRMRESVRMLEQFEEYDGVRAITSLFSVDNEGYQLYESGLFGQSCFRASFALAAMYDEDVSCGEDWRFDQQGCMMSVDPTPTYWMVCRWGLGIYHISGRGEDDQVLNWTLAERHAESLMPKPETLTPQLRRDYLREISAFMQSELNDSQLQTWNSQVAFYQDA